MNRWYQDVSKERSLSSERNAYLKCFLFWTRKPSSELSIFVWLSGFWACTDGLQEGPTERFKVGSVCLVCSSSSAALTAQLWAAGQLQPSLLSSWAAWPGHAITHARTEEIFTAQSQYLLIRAGLRSTPGLSSPIDTCPGQTYRLSSKWPSSPAGKIQKHPCRINLYLQASQFIEIPVPSNHSSRISEAYYNHALGVLYYQLYDLDSWLFVIANWSSLDPGLS